MSDPTIANIDALKKHGVARVTARGWREDARLFARQACRDEPDDWQDDFLAAISGIQLPGQPAVMPMLALKACKGPGKSRAFAWAIWWWLCTRWHSNVVAMSITADNLKDNLWSELARVQERCWMAQQFFNLSSERIVARRYERTWWCSARSFPQNADKNQQANTIAGLHGRHPAVFCDEVGDYPDGVVVAAEAIFSTLVDGLPVDARLAVAGNPTSTEGPLYRVCTRDRARWWVKEITGDPKDPKRAKRIDPAWAQAQIDQWGADNPFVLVNVFGKFPPQQSNKLLGPDEVMAASLRETDARQDPVIMGLDVARFGDNESVLFRRQGRMSYRPLSWRETDLMTLADQVANEVTAQKPAALFVDQTGVGGGVLDRLRQLGISAIGIDFGGSPMDSKFADRRSEMWWKMADWLKRGGCIPNDVGLRSELSTPNFDFTQSGKITKFKLESKADMRKRGVGSPDRADALALTFAAPVYQPPHVLQLTESSRYGYAPRGHGRIRGGTEEDWDPFQEGA